MKRIMIGAAAILLLITGSGAGYAQDRAEVEAGVKLWYNKWKSSGPPGNFTSDYTLLLGPAVTARFESGVFLDGSFLFSTSDYKFPDGFTFDRRDFEAAVGYMIINKFGLLVGYKSVLLDETEPGIQFEESLYGPMIGAVGKIPVNGAFSLYGNVNYLFTRFKVEDETGTSSEDSPGWFAEAGVKYAFTEMFRGTAGYKYETSKGKDSDVRDTFAGVTVALLLVF